MLRAIRLLRLVRVLAQGPLAPRCVRHAAWPDGVLWRTMWAVWAVTCRKRSLGQRPNIVKQLHTSSPGKFVHDARGHARRRCLCEFQTLPLRDVTKPSASTTLRFGEGVHWIFCTFVQIPVQVQTPMCSRHDGPRQ